MTQAYWWSRPVKPVDQLAQTAAFQHQHQLTKPPGSLGDLEKLAGQFAGWQSQLYPELDHIQVVVFAGDHGVGAQGVSAFPQSVTGQMIRNFLSGGAAINVLSRSLGAHLSVVNLGTVEPIVESMLAQAEFVNIQIAPGTADFSKGPAMTVEQLELALRVGADSADDQTQLFIGGEMGIGNTSSASAIYAVLLALPVNIVTGPGTGIDHDGLLCKQRVITDALELHQSVLNNAMDVLHYLGGFEIAALVGSYITCAQRGIPVLVDGFIGTAAALVAVELNPSVRDWMLFSHCSAEPAHRLALEKLQAKPLLDLGLCLGEGSGAAVAVPLIQAALLLHKGMATFEQAGVSNGSE